MIPFFSFVQIKKRVQLTSIKESFLSDLLEKQWGEKIFSSLENNQKISIRGAAGSSCSIFAAKYFNTYRKNILFVADDKEDALYITTELEEMCGKKNIFYFPATYLDPYQVENTQNANRVLRTDVIHRLHSTQEEKIIVAPASALSEKVIQKNDFKNYSHSIKVGEALDFDFVDELLHHYQFKRTDFVSEPGEFSVRGGIIDVFSYAYKYPFRLSFFGNEIDSIKTFDIESQLTIEKVKEFQLVSALDETALQTSKVSFLEILPENTVLFFKNAFLCVKILKDFYEKAKNTFNDLNKDIQYSSPEKLFLSEEEFYKSCEKFPQVDFSTETLASSKEIEFHCTEQPAFNKNFDILIQDLEDKLNQGFDAWISFSSEKQKIRLQNIFEEKEKNIPFKSFISQLHAGFVDYENKISVYTDHQIFDRYQRFHAKNSFAKSEQLTIKDLTSLKIGDYITHIDYGIGQFKGLVKQNNNGKIQECFKLSYKNGDLLYVSIHALHKISRYNGQDGKEISLSKLGSPAWKNLKQKTKSRVKKLAFDLIKLYAERKTAKGYAFAPDGYLQNELEASFVYEDTPDQEKATEDVKADMQADTVMDRLICGDVGFGKTEVAIRAAFKAAVNGKQTAVLVPTTILAFQHYRSFKERLKDFPVEVSYLNRFRTAKQKRETLEGLASGKIDIVIGTHQLASSKVKFKDLGLLVIDEEHKFGVSVKDKLKTMKTNVDTLTLTATPIPRTLQFSLMAARDLSVIKTPPPNRQPVETRLIGFKEEILRDAISYELQRDGQVFFINNRIENLKEIAGLIQRLVPDARVITGHGQMDGKQLETNMIDFIEGKYDVLVSTTIVESGMDVPNANTIFINDAQRFGMADLHQMRGRVGRGNRKAFCYLITPPLDLVSSDSRKRLQAVEEFSDLGSGFHIAMKDLEIRGAGDLLGADQSGFINEMGFDTYQKIMQEALEELKDENMEELFKNEEDRKKLFNFTKDVNIDTDMELMLPSEYVQNTEERLILYQRLADAKDKAELDQIEYELKDRFGTLPKTAIDLLKSIELKWTAAEIGFERIIIRNETFLGYFPGNPQDKFYQSETFKNIIQYLASHPQEGQLKEKHHKEGNQLLLRKENISTIDEVNQLLNNISIKK